MGSLLGLPFGLEVVGQFLLGSCHVLHRGRGRLVHVAALLAADIRWMEWLVVPWLHMQLALDTLGTL